jgi:hypothetical protein
MSFNIPTLQELYRNHLSRLETALGQESPLNDKSFLSVLAKTEAGQDIGLFKYASDRARANLALTARNTDLDNIGRDLGVIRRTAQAAVLEAELTATDGTVIPTTADFIADANGLRYRPVESVTASGGVAVLDLLCVESGSSGNLADGDELQISSQIAGAQTVATVTDTLTLGVEKESDADYRPRVLFAQRAITGGANATDYKIWSEAVIGVRRAFPYSGRPPAEGASFPGDRTIYIEATSDIDSDGIAPTVLLDEVRSQVNYDPDTGEARSPLGLTDDTLFIESISRTDFFVEVRDLVVEVDRESQCKNAISDALTVYFDTIRPFVDGVDLVQERMDTVTTLTVARTVQDVLRSFGATSSSIGFGVFVGVFVTQYILGQGELGKLAGVSYA